MNCRKDRGRKCGSSWRNSVFRVNTYRLQRMRHVSVVGETYMGCYKDAKKRDLRHYLGKGNWNYKKCFELAKMRGFKYASLQASGYCFGDNRFGKYGKRPDSECNQKCRNDKGRICGAGWRNSVFKVDTVKIRWGNTHKPVMGEKYMGCYVDTRKRDLPVYLAAGHGSYRACFEAAKMRGFRYAGLQVDGQCFGGNSYGKYGRRPDN